VACCRGQCDWAIERLAAEGGVSKNTVLKAKRGGSVYPSSVHKIASALDVYPSWERMRDIGAAGWKASDGRRHLLGATLDLALDFQTWSTPVGYRGGIGYEQAVELMVEMVRCAMVGD
jgi:hypothetical protein